MFLLPVRIWHQPGTAFPERANTYMERNAAAVMENHMEVPTAIMLVGKMNPIITAMIMAMAILVEQLRL